MRSENAKRLRRIEYTNNELADHGRAFGGVWAGLSTGAFERLHRRGVGIEPLHTVARVKEVSRKAKTDDPQTNDAYGLLRFTHGTSPVDDPKQNLSMSVK